jgi:hypothetical protein
MTTFARPGSRDVDLREETGGRRGGLHGQEPAGCVPSLPAGTPLTTERKDPYGNGNQDA